MSAPTQLTVLEREYCANPATCDEPDVAFIGGGMNVAHARYALQKLKASNAEHIEVVILEQGPFDLIDHVGNSPGFSRRHFINAPARLGGKLMTWGVSTPRPRPRVLKSYPYDQADLTNRFDSVERELGIHDEIPLSNRNLELFVLNALREKLDGAKVTVAPLAINRYGKRWHPLKYVPELVAGGVKLVCKFRVAELRASDGKVQSITGQWADGNSYEIRPKQVLVGVGVEKSIPLLQPVLGSIPIRVSDHHRVDCHGFIPAYKLLDGSNDDLGVAVIIAEFDDEYDDVWTPFHVEVKVAPLELWQKGFMQSSDNLVAVHKKDVIYVQLQAVSAMKDRLPIINDMLNVANPIRPVMTTRDGLFHGRLVKRLTEVAQAIGLQNPTFNFRELTTNHHLYRAYEVGETLSNSFRSLGHENLYVLPPAGFLPDECDANPTLKSLVLGQYAVDDALSGFVASNNEVPNYVL